MKTARLAWPQPHMCYALAGCLQHVQGSRAGTQCQRGASWLSSRRSSRRSGRGGAPPGGQPHAGFLRACS